MLINLIHCVFLLRLLTQFETISGSVDADHKEKIEDIGAEEGEVVKFIGAGIVAGSTLPSVSAK